MGLSYNVSGVADFTILHPNPLRWLRQPCFRQSYCLANDRNSELPRADEDHWGGSVRASRNSFLTTFFLTILAICRSLNKKAHSFLRKNGQLPDITSVTQPPFKRPVALRPILSNSLPLSVTSFLVLNRDSDHLLILTGPSTRKSL